MRRFFNKKVLNYILDPAREVPPEYRGEIEESLTICIKKRIKVLCLSFLGVFSLGQILSAIFYPQNFDLSIRIPNWIAVGLGIFMILFLSKRVKTLFMAKSVAYLFPLVFLGMLTLLPLCQSLSDGLFSIIIMLILMLFFVSLVIPWQVSEVFWLLIVYIGVHTLSHVFLPVYGKTTAYPLWGSPTYVNGLVYLTISGILCMVIRYNETFRDIRNFLLLKEIEKKNEQMRKELELASRVHMSLVPESIITPRADIFVTYLPMESIGGDYAKFHFLEKDRLIFMISDVTGHGIPAALLVNRVHAEFERLADFIHTPGELLDELNKFILEDFKGTGMYLSAFCGLLDFRYKEFNYSNYGHPPQYLYRMQDEELRRLESQTSFLGIESVKQTGIYETKIKFEDGDRLVLFTDGVIETMNGQGEEYGEKRLEEFLKNHQNINDQLWNELLISDLNNYKFGDFKDDIFILNIRIKKG